MSKALAQAFEVFWAAYPPRPDNPKAAARAVFERRVREGADPAAIAAAAGRYAAFVKASKKDSLFIPHARTWLSQRRYEDFPEPAPEATAPAVDHPLAWLREEIGADKWSSWVEPTTVEITDDEVTIYARTRFAADHIAREWGLGIIWPHYHPRHMTITVRLG